MSTALFINTLRVELWLLAAVECTADYDATPEAAQFHDRLADAIGDSLPSPLSEWLYRPIRNELVIRLDTSAPHVHLNAFMQLLMEDTKIHEALTYSREGGWAYLAHNRPTRFLSAKEVRDEVYPWLNSFGISEGDITCPS